MGQGNNRNRQIRIGLVMVADVAQGLGGTRGVIDMVNNARGIGGSRRTENNTLGVFYKAIIILDYIVFAFWFIFIMYWVLAKVMAMAEVNKK